ncbi:MAG: TIR domain-containing protein [Vicinamibacteria bacterium]
MVKKRVFVSFDFDNDKTLKDFIIGQSRLDDSPFDVIDQSLKEAAPERDWVAKARAAIARSDTLIVMLGSATRRAPGVLKEIAIAAELGKPTFQIIGYRDGSADWGVPGGGRVYRWDWDNLKKLLG